MRAHAQILNSAPPLSANPRRAVAATLAAAALTACGCWMRAPSAGEAPSVDQPRSIYALGTLEPVGGVIAVSGTPGDVLKALDPDVREGEPAPAGGVLGLMASYDTQRAQIEALRNRRRMADQKHAVDVLLADANVRAAEAQVKEAEAKQSEARLHEETLETLEETAAIAREEHESLKSLRESDSELVTGHQLRKQANELARAESEVRLARERAAPMIAAADAALESARANLAAAKVRARSLDMQHEVDAIEKEISVAEQGLTRSVVWAPGADRSGLNEKDPLAAGDPPGRYTVLQVLTKPGEAVAQLPVLKLADLSEIECVAEVYEADVKHIKLGQGATVTSPAFSEPFSGGLRGVVTYISSVVTSPGLKSPNPLAPQDRSVVEVRVRLKLDTPDALEEAAGRIGLQVRVKFDPPDETPAGEKGQSSAPVVAQ